MAILTDTGSRGVKDVFLRLCDGFKGRTRGGGERVAAGERANVHHSPHS